MTAGAQERGWDAHYATEAGVRRWPNEELVRWISERRFDVIVDVGAGTGSNTKFLASVAASVTAVEPNETARLHMENRCDLYSEIKLWDVVAVVDGVATALPVASGTADLVVDCMTSQHLSWDDHGVAFAEYARVLAPGGWLWLYHLDDQTECDRMVRVPDPPLRSGRVNEHDYELLSLFPTVALTCLPPRAELATLVVASGFDDIYPSRLVREYESGDRASYSVIAAQLPGD